MNLLKLIPLLLIPTLAHANWFEINDLLEGNKLVGDDESFYVGKDVNGVPTASALFGVVDAEKNMLDQRRVAVVVADCAKGGGKLTWIDVDPGSKIEQADWKADDTTVFDFAANSLCMGYKEWSKNHTDDDAPPPAKPEEHKHRPGRKSQA